MKKLVIGILIVSLLIFSAGSSFAEKSPFQGDPGETYYMCVMVSGVEYWFPVYEMFKQAGRQLGVKTVYTGTPEYDVNKQLAVFEQILAKKPAGIFLHPMNPDPFIEPINRAYEMGIPVVTFAADSPNSKRVSYITSDNVREGYFAAAKIGMGLGHGEGGLIGLVGILVGRGAGHNLDIGVFGFDAFDERFDPQIVIVLAGILKGCHFALAA